MIFQVLLEGKYKGTYFSWGTMETLCSLYKQPH